jgi:hypothetical protein
MIESGNVSFDLQDKVDRELESGERVVWMDQPVPRYFTAGSISAFLFAIPWTAFAVFWMYGAAGFKVPDFTKGPEALFPLFGLPFVLIGLAMLSTPYWTFLKALRTVYVITDRRAILFEGGWSTTIRSFFPQQLRDIYRKERRNGSGDVILGRQIGTDSDGDKHSTGVGFLNVRDAKGVEAMLRSLASQAR